MRAAILSATPAPVAQRIEHLTTDQKVRGSNPFGRFTSFAPRWGPPSGALTSFAPRWGPPSGALCVETGRRRPLTVDSPKGAAAGPVTAGYQDSDLVASITQGATSTRYTLTCPVAAWPRRPSRRPGRGPHHRGHPLLHRRVCRRRWLRPDRQMLGLGCEWIASKAQSAWRSVTSSRAWNATARYGRWEGGSAGSAGTPVRPGAIADPPNTRSPSTCETGGAGGTDDLRPRSGLRVGTGGCCRCRPLEWGSSSTGRLAAEGKSDAVWPLGSDWNRNRVALATSVYAVRASRRSRGGAHRR